MNRRQKHSLLAVALASSMWITTSHAPADSLVTTDGDMMVGTVTKTATGYTIQTPGGSVDLPADKVKRVLYDHPPAAQPTAPAKAVDPSDPRRLKMLKSLIDQGQAAMESASFSDARDAFKDALAIDTQNAVAARGLGFAYVALGNPAKACPPLEIAALSTQMDRSMVLAYSAALVADHSAMRAVKVIKPYLEAHSTPVDETMLNALGTALSQASSVAAKSDLYKSSVALYLKLNTALEATHPGKRRWGMEWEDSSDVAAKEAERKKVQAKVDAAWNKLQSANAQVTSAQAAFNEASTTLGKRQDAKIRNTQEKLTQANNAQASAQSDYDAASKDLAAAPAASFPNTIAVANSDLSTFSPSASPSGTDSTAVASAAPTSPKAAAAPVHSSEPAKPAAAQEQSDPTPAVAPPQPAVSRHVTRYAAAFAIAPDVLVTAWSVVDGATNISVQSADGKSRPATVLQSHQGDGLALLKVEGANFPSLIVAGSVGTGSFSCMGFPEVDLFNPIPHTMGVTVDPAPDVWTAHFDTPPRVPGGPLLQNGAVVGVELGDRDSDPQSVPVANLKAVQSIANDSAHGGAIIDPKLAVLQVTAER